MKIHIVESRRDLKDFINLQYRIYKRDKVWVPPLRSENRKQFSPKTNPYLRHCEWQLFLLKDKGKVIGRIAAFIDTLAIEFWNERVGIFGHFECIHDNTASKMLLEAAKNWLIEKECTSMRGPWSFSPDEWGMVIEGFTPSPVIMSPYNPPFYNEQMTNFGLKKAKDLICWRISIAEGYRIPNRIMSLTDKVAHRYGIKVRCLDMKNYDEEIQNVIDISNATLSDNWGYSPVTEDEVNAIAKDLKRIIQAKGVLFAEDKNGRLIGFAIVFPDINTLLKGLNGRLLPFGFVKLLWGIPRLKKYRMFALGVIPEYQGKAVDSLLYRALNESLYSKDLLMEINYVLEDNWPMINAIKKLDAKESRRYRVYEMAIP